MPTSLSLFFVLSWAVVQRPLPEYVPPPTPARLSARTLEAVRVLADRVLYEGRGCTVSPEEGSIGPYRKVSTYLEPDDLTLSSAKRSRTVYVLRDPKLPGGLDMIIIGEPMTRKQLRRLVDEKRYRPSYSYKEIAELISETDGAPTKLDSPFTSWDPGSRREFQGLLAAPRIEGERGARRFVYDTIGHGGVPRNVIAQLDGEGGLDLVITRLKPLPRVKKPTAPDGADPTGPNTTGNPATKAEPPAPKPWPPPVG